MSDTVNPNAISVIVITKNEAHDIRECLESVRGWVNQIIVFDSGSTDGTQDICRELGAEVSETDWPGFGQQKQRALDAAAGPWILSLDADERISTDLRDEILAAVAAASAKLFQIPRESSYCGTWIHHSGWSPDHVLRLFHQDTARFSRDLVHERLIPVEGHAIATLSNKLIHYSFRDFSEVAPRAVKKADCAKHCCTACGALSGLILSSAAISTGKWAWYWPFPMPKAPTTVISNSC